MRPGEGTPQHGVRGELGHDDAARGSDEMFPARPLHAHSLSVLLGLLLPLRHTCVRVQSLFELTTANRLS